MCLAIVCGTNPHRREPRTERCLAALAPADLPIRPCGQALRDFMYRDRRMCAIAHRSCAGPTALRAGWRHGRRLVRSPPDLRVAADANHVQQAAFAELVSPVGLGAVGPHRLARRLPQSLSPARCRSDPWPALSWSETRPDPERLPSCAAQCPEPTAREDTADSPLAGCRVRWRSTNSRQLGNCPSCQGGRSTGVQHRPNAPPSLKIPCRPRSSDTLRSSCSGSAAPVPLPPPAALDRSNRHRPPDGASIDGLSARSAGAPARPWAPRSCALQAVATPSGTSMRAVCDPHGTGRQPLLPRTVQNALPVSYSTQLSRAA